MKGLHDARSDAQLVADLAAGDQSAFESLYLRHRDWVVRLAYRFTGNADDALDVLQETFAYLLRKGTNLHLSARLTTFLYPVVRNLSLETRRKRRPSDDSVLDDLPAPTQEHSELDRVIRILPPAHREVILMRYLDDMSLEEIATAIGIPIGTVKSRIHHALQMLRDDPGTREYFGAGGGFLFFFPFW